MLSSNSPGGVAQFFDRDFPAEMAKVGMEGLQEFMVRPDNLDAILKRLWPNASPALIEVCTSDDTIKRRNSRAFSLLDAPDGMWNVSVGASSAIRT